MISVQAVSAATQRLEAAPAKDLDSWVAELERITGKKLDEWVEKQGCRTEVVSRLSVAFDGLKWNAKAADILFQRAQTIPPSEAKIWKEAFERLLNNKIEQACLVPLVLIPVDALYEGQKYSAERAKKYLARMKQLTADDVALWRDKVDQWGGTRLDAAMNIILLDDYFDKETVPAGQVQGRDRGKETVAAKGRLTNRCADRAGKALISNPAQYRTSSRRGAGLGCPFGASIILTDLGRSHRMSAGWEPGPVAGAGSEGKISRRGPA